MLDNINRGCGCGHKPALQLADIDINMNSLIQISESFNSGYHMNHRVYTVNMTKRR